jgi:hypothetical protein
LLYNTILLSKMLLKYLKKYILLAIADIPNGMDFSINYMTKIYFRHLNKIMFFCDLLSKFLRLEKWLVNPENVSKLIILCYC